MINSKLFKPKKQKANFFRKFVNFYFALFLILLAFVLGLIVGNGSNPTVKGNLNKQEDGQVFNKKARPEFLSKDVNFNIFWETWEIIEKNYVRQPVSETELLYGAITGSVASLGDLHTVFFDPQTTKEFTEELQGKFEGIGAEIAIKKDRLTIVAPLPDSPAENAGLRSGDKVYEINGEDTTGISLDYAVSKIRGPKGTEVILTIGRESLEDLQEIEIIRDTIRIQSVKYEVLDNNIIHLKVRYFNGDTASDFNNAVLEIINKNPRGIIFDLRNNPGGFLETSIEVASEWVEDGVVVYERLSDGKLKKHKAKGRARLKDFPTVVLINEGSASGSEIVAGALQDYGLAILIGEQTFGKGSVQSLFDLSDGSTIKLTTAEWLTPNENTIDGDGIEPDIEIELTEEDFSSDLDPQLDKAIEILLAK